MGFQDKPRQAIEDYLEALLHDDETTEPDAFVAPLRSEPSEEAQPASWQEKQLRGFMQRAPQAAKPAAPAPLSFDEPAPAPSVLMPELQVAPEVTEAETSPAAEPVPEPAAEVSVEPAVMEAEPEVELVSDADLTAAISQPPGPPGWTNGRPAWAQEAFECLLFKVKGLTLAVPLIELGGIIKIEKQPTPLFGQPQWFAGMLRSNGINVGIVDTAQWVLPPALIEKNDEPYKLVIRIHESHWGLACNQVDRSIRLQPDQVRWRSSLGKRPWLAGTVIEHMCALIDATEFDRLLKEGHGDMEPANLAALKEIDQ